MSPELNGKDYQILRTQNIISSKIHVSVIMAAYNSANYLDRAMESILGQSYAAFECVVVNDGSTDETLEILTSWQERDSRVVIINQKNIGLTKSLNRALQHACGYFVARHDADDISTPERLATQVAFLSHHPDVAVLGTGISLINISGDIYRNKAAPKTTEKEVKDCLQKRNCLAHGSVMLNRKIIGDDLFYDVRFRYAQDYDLWLRLAQKYPVQNITAPLYLYRVTETTISRSKIEEQCQYAALAQWFIRYPHERDKWDGQVSRVMFTTQSELCSLLLKLLLINEEPQLAASYYPVWHPVALSLRIIGKLRLINLGKKIIRGFSFFRQNR